MAEKIKEEIKIEDKRSFLGIDEETKYYVVAPTAEDIRGADWNYSKIFTKSLTEGITTSHEMMDILMRRGVIGPEFEQRAAELSEILNTKIMELETAETMEDKRNLSIDVAQAREELFQWNQRLNGPMSNTCEQMADDSRLEYLTSCMVQDENEDKVWTDYDNFLREKSQALALRARFEVMLYLQGLESNFLEQTPEAKAMKEVETDVLNKTEAALKAAQAVADEEAVAEEESVVDKKKKAPIKKARKKKK